MKEVKPSKKPLLFYYGIVLLCVVLFNAFIAPMLMDDPVKEVDYGTFMRMVDNKEVDKVQVNTNEITFMDKEGKVYYTSAMEDPDLTQRLYESGAAFDRVIEKTMSPLVSYLITGVLPIILFVALGQYLYKRLMSQAGGKDSLMFGGMGKSNAKIYIQSTEGIHFDDVAGEDEAKESLAEVVDYLHNPTKYSEVGASMPKGLLLVGPPGTGKTMLAKAVAGESNVPFFSISGSEFVEMFVGMGASKVRDLFEQAKEKAPCIVFIDEIDAIGKKRDGQFGGNDEREQTLNQLLTEMDGFDGSKGVVVLAATNRPDSLDPALLRPGRFDRQIYVGLPDIKGREEILRVHAKGKPLAEDVDLKRLAQGTPGFTGADLENLINEGALLAARRKRKFITMADLKEAEIKVIAGPEKKSRVIPQHERELTAYHEAGHAVVMHVLPDHDPVTQITIVPRGKAGGMTISLPEEDRSYLSKRYMEDQIVALLGGRVAEKLCLGDISTGASNDIEQATKLARAMLTRYGMSDRFDMVALEVQSNKYLGGDSSLACSEKTAGEIDEAVIALVKRQHQKAVEILKANEGALHRLAGYLLEKETITGEEFMDILGKC